MIWTVRVAPDAEVELEASARWYDQRAGLRTESNAIAEGPLRYPPLMNDSHGSFADLVRDHETDTDED